MSKKHWISVKRGLSEDPKHRQKMDRAIWVFLHMLDAADWETGIIHDWRDAEQANEMSLSMNTVRDWRQRLIDFGYIECIQKARGLDIVIYKWINPRSYGSKVLNPIKGDVQTSPSSSEGDAEGDAGVSSQDVTLTLNPNPKPNINKENEYLKIIRACALTHWGHDFNAWHHVEKVLEGANFERTDHTLIISGVGLKAGEYEDRYGKTFERDLLGGLNEEIKIKFEE